MIIGAGIGKVYNKDIRYYKNVGAMVILVIIGLQYHFFLPAFSIRLMIISAKKKKVERTSPVPQSPKGKGSFNSHSWTHVPRPHGLRPEFCRGEFNETLPKPK